jgi:hypothetical protein
MRKKTFFITLLLIAAMLMQSVAFAQQTPEEMGYIPIRQFFEEIGAVVTWDENERSVVVEIDGGALVLIPGESFGYVNGETVQMIEGTILWQGRTFISEIDLTILFSAFMGVEVEIATFYLTEEARDLALEDFDYVLEIILANSPWESVIQRRLGINLTEHFAYHRQYIENMVPREYPVIPELFIPKDGDDARSLAANYLMSMLFFDIALPLEGIGHLSPRDRSTYMVQYPAFLIQSYDATGEFDSENNFSLPLMLEVFDSPAAAWLYGEIEVDLYADIMGSAAEVAGNIVTEILASGEIAYLGIRSFLTCAVYDDAVTLPFLRETQDFDHLIIDLRNNGGGFAHYFPTSIMRRLINEPIEITSYEFFSGGDFAMEWINAALETALNINVTSDIQWAELISAELVSAQEFIDQQNMTQFNRDDLQRLNHAMVSRAMVYPSDEVNFNGTVWILINERSASASSMAASLALSTGFATVVGENSSGVMGSTFSYFLLPNTGIIWRLDIGYQTDAYGRSLEVYGISPNIRNRDGMDALETVLAIISE